MIAIFDSMLRSGVISKLGGTPGSAAMLATQRRTITCRSQTLYENGHDGT